MKKNIAILTSGGDCSGMNACIYYAYKYAKLNGCKLFGIYDGFKGLLEDSFVELDYKTVKEHKCLGGTFLYSARVKDFRKKEVQEVAVKNLKKHNIEILIVCGGDGSFHGAYALSKFGLKMYGIPCTIDNDIFYSDYSIGFASAVSIDTFCINAIIDTMTSHKRIGITETMGRNNGEIALYAGLRANADLILIPEVPTSIDDIAAKIDQRIKDGFTTTNIIVAEGVMHANELGDKLKEKNPSLDIKCSNLGYLQRGGISDPKDVIFAKNLFKHLFKLMNNGIYNKCLGIKNNKIIDIDVDDIDNYHEHEDFNDYIKLLKGVKL